MPSDHSRSFPYSQNYRPESSASQYQDSHRYVVDQASHGQRYDNLPQGTGGSPPYQYQQSSAPSSQGYGRATSGTSYPSSTGASIARPATTSPTHSYPQQSSLHYYQQSSYAPISAHATHNSPNGSAADGANTYPNYGPLSSGHQPMSSGYGMDYLSNSHSRPRLTTEYPPLSTGGGTRVGSSSSGSSSYPGQPAQRSPTSPTSPGTERFMCNLCDKSFSRSHDRKRHYETQHSSNPAIHRCRYCKKPFSRGDSLKRHQDNGCDEMPNA